MLVYKNILVFSRWVHAYLIKTMNVLWFLIPLPKFHVRMQEWKDYNVKQIKHFVADIKPLSYTRCIDCVCKVTWGWWHYIQIHHTTENVTIWALRSRVQCVRKKNSLTLCTSPSVWIFLFFLFDILSYR